MKRFVMRCLAPKEERPDASTLLADEFLVKRKAHVERTTQEKAAADTTDARASQSGGAGMLPAAPELGVARSATGDALSVRGQWHRGDASVKLRLKVQMRAGEVKTVEFPFLLTEDTPEGVAREMIEELHLFTEESFVARIAENIRCAVAPAVDWQQHGATATGTVAAALPSFNAATPLPLPSSLAAVAAPSAAASELVEWPPPPLPAALFMPLPTSGVGSVRNASLADWHSANTEPTSAAAPAAPANVGHLRNASLAEWHPAAAPAAPAKVPASQYPYDVAKLMMSQLSLSAQGPTLCSKLGITCVSDLVHVTEQMLKDELPAMKPVERARLLSGIAKLASPAVDNVLAPPSSGLNVMLSYRVPESGAGGDGAVFALQKALESRGFSVFVGEGAIEGGASWPDTIQKGVEQCHAFVVICSETCACCFAPRYACLLR